MRTSIGVLRQVHLPESHRRNNKQATALLRSQIPFRWRLVESILFVFACIEGNVPFCGSTRGPQQSEMVESKQQQHTNSHTRPEGFSIVREPTGKDPSVVQIIVRECEQAQNNSQVSFLFNVLFLNEHTSSHPRRNDMIHFAVRTFIDDIYQAAESVKLPLILLIML